MPRSSSNSAIEVIPRAQEQAQPQNAMDVLRAAFAQINDQGLLDYQELHDVADYLAKVTKDNRDEFAYSVASADLLNDYSFIKVDAFRNSPDLVLWGRGPEDEVYRPISPSRLKELFTIYYKRNRLGRLAPKIATAANTLLNEVTDSVNQIPGRVIRVASDMYYDTKTGGLYKKVEYMDNEGEGAHGDPICCRSLFDSVGAKITVDINSVQFDHADVAAVEEYLNDRRDGSGQVAFSDPDTFLKEMEPYEDKHGSMVSVKALSALKFFWTAADSNLGRYNDLIKTFMMEFQYEKPGFFFFFIGEKVNGKSSMQMCRHVLFGNRNVTTLSMQQLTSWDYSLDLARAMTNAPLEDCDPKIDNLDADLGMLKCIATHETINARMKNQPTGISFTPNFLSFFPRNKIPDFGDNDGLQAFVGRRTKIIHFTHDFSNEANNGKNFEKETFTAPFYSGLLPLLIGMAKCYIGRKIELSEESEAFATEMGAIMDPVTHFLNRVYYWFDYIGSPTFLQEQAKLFFKDNGIANASKKAETVPQKIARLQESRPGYAARRIAPGTNYYGDYTVKKGRCRICPKKPGDDEERIKIFAPDAKLAVLGDMSPEEYYRKLDADSVEGQYAHSIITILDDIEKEGNIKPVAYQQAMLDLDEKRANGEFEG